jgi:hypothetical protein
MPPLISRCSARRRASSTSSSPLGVAVTRKGVFEAPKFQADVTKSPIPRFDLLKLKH